MFLSCRPRIWCVSDDSELFLGSFGLTECYEKHFGVLEQEVWMISGDFFLRFFGEFLGCIFEKSKNSREALRALLLELPGDEGELME